MTSAATAPVAVSTAQGGQAIDAWGLSIDAPLVVDDVAAVDWADQADLIVVGLGGAGVAAALEALEQGATVIAADRYEGGGSSAANGGVFYAGGGTRIQQEAGVEDTPDNMYAYLKMEVGDVVTDATLRKFCDDSPATVDWLTRHGVPFEGSLYSKKASYPPLDKFLYHPDSSLAEPYASVARPAARGHRGKMYNGKKAWGLGGAIFNPLRDAALARGMTFLRHAEARRLAVDPAGRVIGVQLARIADPRQGQRFAHHIARASVWMAMLPPSLPGAQITFAVARWHLTRAWRIEAQHRVTAWYRARKGVVLSAGGFILNNDMVRHFARPYAASLPNGTLGDTGSGIMLGVSAGGATDLMARVSAWRMINPPSAFSESILVNAQGARYVNETLYGAAIGEAMVERNDGRGYLILDKALVRRARRQAFGPGVLPFQRDLALINTLFAARRAPTLAALARRMGFDVATLEQAVAENNRAARGEIPDPFGKRAADMAEIRQGPFYAIDVSADAKWFPLACMTVGGLVVDEDTGLVKRASGAVIPGLYAAGRTAIGLCSNLYVSGLSYADCIFSGRRAARHAATMDVDCSAPSSR
ncbi:FAD-binding protein [Parapedomonas caeni]